MGVFGSFSQHEPSGDDAGHPGRRESPSVRRGGQNVPQSRQRDRLGTFGKLLRNWDFDPAAFFPAGFGSGDRMVQQRKFFQNRENAPGPPGAMPRGAKPDHRETFSHGAKKTERAHTRSQILADRGGGVADFLAMCKKVRQ